MPLLTAEVGTTQTTEPLGVDNRWATAFAASLGDPLPCYFDTTRPDGIVAHPLFPVCVEWPAMLEAQRLTGGELTLDERLRGVHATHDLVVHRLVRPPEALVVKATIVGAERRSPGAYALLRLDTTDIDGDPVCTTWYGTIYLGVDVEGADCPAADLPESPPPASSTTVRARLPLTVPATAPYVYAECSRIWNPIHTDPAVAARAGLPGIIMHGTGTLGMAITTLLEHEAPEEPWRVARVSARFGAMVPVPSELTVEVGERARWGSSECVRFAVRTGDGALAVRDAFLILR